MLFITYWVRDASGESQLPLSWAIHKLPRNLPKPLDLVIGVVAVGYKADFNVIDLERLHLHAPQVSYDLPAGGCRLRQKADGDDATIVSGVVTYRNGAATGALPGRLVRRARPSLNALTANR